jgi:hypothetical protein
MSGGPKIYRSGFNRVSGSGSGFRRAKITHKIIKRIQNFEMLDIFF